MERCFVGTLRPKVFDAQKKPDHCERHRKDGVAEFYQREVIFDHQTKKSEIGPVRAGLGTDAAVIYELTKLRKGAGNIFVLSKGLFFCMFVPIRIPAISWKRS